MAICKEFLKRSTKQHALVSFLDYIVMKDILSLFMTGNSLQSQKTSESFRRRRNTRAKRANNGFNKFIPKTAKQKLLQMATTMHFKYTTDLTQLS